MINLASMRYARVLEEDGGPVSRLEGSRIDREDGTLYQVNAYLSERLNLRTRMPSVFPQADGCGTDRSLMVARHMAISEALERWALYDLYARGCLDDTGLGMDPTSTGMAAFPGLQAWQSRKRARAEAMERYVLARWATGEASCQWLDTGHEDVAGISIASPFREFQVVVVWRQYAPGRFSYGFSGSRRLARAIYKAVIEMDRLARALGFLQAGTRGSPLPRLSAIQNPMERRILRFATRSGHDAFLSHVITTTGRRARFQRPRAVFDGRLRGPWDHYAIVWRTLYPMPEAVYSGDPTLFYW